MDFLDPKSVIAIVGGLVALLVVGLAMSRVQSASGAITVIMVLLIGAVAGFLMARIAKLPSFVSIYVGEVELPIIWMVAGVTVFVGLFGAVSKPAQDSSNS